MSEDKAVYKGLSLPDLAYQVFTAQPREDIGVVKRLIMNPLHVPWTTLFYGKLMWFSASLPH